MPWETEYGYAQGLKQDGIVWLSGQVGHDENGAIAPDMETHMLTFERYWLALT